MKHNKRCIVQKLLGTNTVQQIYNNFPFMPLSSLLAFLHSLSHTTADLHSQFTWCKDCVVQNSVLFQVNTYLGIYLTQCEVAKNKQVYDALTFPYVVLHTHLCYVSFYLLGPCLGGMKCMHCVFN